MREAPDEPFHRYNLGVALQLLWLNPEAEKTLRRAIKTGAAPRHLGAVGLRRAGACRRRSGAGSEARHWPRPRCELAPDWAAGWCALGEAWAAAGRHDDALQAYAARAGLRGAIAAPRRRAGRHGVAGAQRHRQDPLRARGLRGGSGLLAHAVAFHPSAPELRVMLAQAYEGTGNSGGLGTSSSSPSRRRPAVPAHTSRSGTSSPTRPRRHCCAASSTIGESRPLLRQIERLREARGTA